MRQNINARIENIIRNIIKNKKIYIIKNFIASISLFAVLITYLLSGKELAFATPQDDTEFEEFVAAAMPVIDNYDVDTRLIVNLSDDMQKDEALSDELQQLGASEVIEGFDDFVILQYDTAKEADEAYKLLENSNLVDYVEFDAELELADTSYNSWGYASEEANPYAINLEAFRTEYDNFLTGNSVTVAIIDSGINPAHEIFNVNGDDNRVLETGFDVGGKTLYSSSVYTDYITTDIYDDNGHGTHVAGMIAEATPANVDLLSVKITDAQGNSSVTKMIMGIEFAIERGADVINISMSAKASGHIQTLDEEIQKATEAGVVVCVAAGNNAANADDYSPANAPTSIAVGATDASGQMASFSNYGNTIDIAAPGVFISSASYLSTTGYMSKSGTSQASPHVAAIAALVKAYDSSLDWQQVLKLMQDNAEVITYSKNDTSYTAPRLKLNTSMLVPYRFYAQSATLDGNFSYLMYMQLSESLRTDEELKMEFVVNDTIQESKQIGTKVISGITYSIFECELGIAQLGDEVVPSLVYDDTAHQLKTVSAKEYLYDILNYADESAICQSVSPIIRSILNYSAYAQKYFDYKTDHLVCEPESVDDVTVETLYADEPIINVNGSDFTYYGSSLVCNSDTALRVYFSMDNLMSEEQLLCDYQYIVNGYEDRTHMGIIGNLVYIELKDIPAKELASIYTFKIFNDDEAYSVQISPVQYIRKGSLSAEGDFSNLCKALYAYHLEALNY